MPAAVQDDTSILSTGGGQADILGLPRATATGEIIMPASTTPITEHAPIGFPFPTTSPNPQPGVPDARSTPVGPAPGTTPEEIAETKRKTELAKSLVEAGIAAGIPASLQGICVPGSSVKGREPKKFNGDPDVPVMPGTLVLYWTQITGNMGWMTVWPIMITEPVMGRDPVTGVEGPTGSYRGASPKSQVNLTRVMHAGRPSPVPRLGFFTPLWQFPPEMCRIDAKANTEVPT